MHRYVHTAFLKVRQIHKQLPPGGILIFLSTQREIECLCTTLRRHYHKTRIRYETDKYRKHAQLKSRQIRAVAATEGKDPDSAEEDSAAKEEKEEGDEFGLHAADYALDGDEDAPEGPEGEPSLLPHDDFDYGVLASTTEGATSSDKPDTDEKEISSQHVKHKRKRAAKGVPASKHVDPRSTTEPEETAMEEEQEEEGEEQDDQEDDDHLELPNEDEEDGSLDTLYILPLYALLSFAKQQRVFLPPPEGKRLCVVATNVAETSITIPNVRYVVDSGRHKAKSIHEETGAHVYRIQWTSQASAEQRSGRAGRTAPGHCYRLYSTGVFANWMSQFETPEILRTPLESVVLMMKNMRIEHVANFPFPTAPTAETLRSAIVHLKLLGAVDERCRCTHLGGQLARYPVPPRYAVMLLSACRINNDRKEATAEANALMFHAVHAMVAVAATSLQVFQEGDSSRNASNREQAAQHKKQIFCPGSDFITFIRAFAFYARHPTARECEQACLVHKSLREAYQLARQLVQISEDRFRATATRDGDCALEDYDTTEEALIVPPTHDTSKARAAFTATWQCSEQTVSKEEEVWLRKVVANGLLDQIARRATPMECRVAQEKYSAGPKTTKTPYFHAESKCVVWVHPNSSIAATQPPPEYVAFAALQRSHRGEGGNLSAPKTFMRGCTILTKQWLDELGYDEEKSQRSCNPLDDGW